MKEFTVFHGSQIVAESDDWMHSRGWPDGSYVRYAQNSHADWYVKRHGNAKAINLSDIPKEIRLLMLLLEVPL